MSYRTRITYTRPSKDVDWYQTTDSALTYRQETYIDTGKLMPSTGTHPPTTESADGLTLVVESEYDSRASLDEFLTDSTVLNDYVNPRTLYCAEHNITRTVLHDVG